MAAPLVPAIQEMSQNIIGHFADGPDDRIARQIPQPRQTRCDFPHGNGHVCADQQVFLIIQSVQLLANGLDVDIKPRQGVRPLIDILKDNRARAHKRHQTAPLVANTRITDRTVRVVENGKPEWLALRVHTQPVCLTVQKAAQLAAAAWVLQFPQGFRFDLANTFACYRELLADLFQRVVGVHTDAETHPQHAFFTRRQ